MSAGSEKILIIDVATSGVSVEKNVIMELCFLLVDNRNYEIVEDGSFVVYWPDGVPGKVPGFHATLAKECTDRDVTYTFDEIEAHLLALPKFQLIANRSIDFDLGFLRATFPEFCKQLRYVPTLDIKGLGVGLGGAAPEQDPATRTHRAPDEALAAYDELVFYADIVREGLSR